MQTGFYSNTGGMVTQFNRLDVISNNLANLNTNGYKRDDVVIGDFMRLFEEKRDILPLENNTKEGSKFLNRSIVRVPQIVQEYTEFSNGAIKQTNNPLDIALNDKDTFISILTPNGIRYTRDGALTINEDGILTTKDGYPVLPSGYSEGGDLIKLPSDKIIKITNNGNIILKDTANLNENELINSIMVVRPQNIKSLTKEGNNLYKTQEPVDEAVGNNLLKQGYLEKSNINPVLEMTALIQTNRLVGMYQKVMDTQMNELNSDAIDKLANVRA
jgi:flagellar basal-body rod protein FlgG